MGERLWQQKNIRSLLIFLAITVILEAKPLPPCCVTPDTGSGAGYCATQLKMKTHPSTVLEEQLSEQLRQFIPEGGKEEKDGGLHAAVMNKLGQLLSFQSCAEVLLRTKEDERKAIIDMIKLPVMQKVRQGKSVHTFQKWKQGIIMYQQRFGITEEETAKILRQQLKGQARGCICRTLQDEDYEKPDILKKMMKNLEDAYTNFTFYEEDDVDVQEQPNSSRKKP